VGVIGNILERKIWITWAGETPYLPSQNDMMKSNISDMNRISVTVGVFFQKETGFFILSAHFVSI